MIANTTILIPKNRNKNLMNKPPETLLTEKNNPGSNEINDKINPNFSIN